MSDGRELRTATGSGGWPGRDTGTGAVSRALRDEGELGRALQERVAGDPAGEAQQHAAERTALGSPGWWRKGGGRVTRRESLGILKGHLAEPPLPQRVPG